MIAFLRGRVAMTTPSAVYLDVNGVGYEVAMSKSSLADIGQNGQEVQVLTYLQVREDAVALYGFVTQDERELFSRLIGISGIGPKVALSILSYYRPEQLADIIAHQDVARLSQVSGIGKKTAGRILLELKDAFVPSQTGLFAQEEQPANTNSEKAAMEALLSMGFTSKEAECALEGADESLDEGRLLRYALKRLGMQR